MEKHLVLRNALVVTEQCNTHKCSKTVMSTDTMLMRDSKRLSASSSRLFHVYKVALYGNGTVT